MRAGVLPPPRLACRSGPAVDGRPMLTRRGTGERLGTACFVADNSFSEDDHSFVGGVRRFEVRRSGGGS